MAKEAYYFSHDFGARNDPKLQKVLMVLGHTGKSVFWDLIEMLYEEGGYLKVSECDNYAFALRSDSECIKRLINDFDLFEKNDTDFWSESVLRRLSKRSDKSEKAALSAKKRWENANASNNNANAMRPNKKRNAIKETIKGKDNKEFNNTDDLQSPEIFEPISIPKNKILKQKKEGAPATKIFCQCRDFWLEEIHPGWLFTAVTGKSLKSIIEKLSKQVKLKNKDSTDDDVINSFKVLCQKLPEWYQDKDLQVINSKFNEVITEIIKNRNGKRAAKGESIFRT